MPRALDWDDLRVVHALASAGTLSGAAVLLGATHTTVARRVERIEESLGVRLFRRGEDGRYGPTEAGQRAVDAASRVQDEVLRLSARVAGGDLRLCGPLRVTTMDILFRRYAGAFASFQERFPEVDLTVVVGNEAASLARREADVALRLSSAPPERLVGRRVDRVDFAVYAERSLARRIGRRSRYERFPWLGWDERLEPPWLDEWLAREAPGARVVLRLDLSSLALREAVAAGLGVHFLATFEGDSDPRLVRVGPPGADHRAFSRDVWLLTLQELTTSSRVRAFLDHLATSLPRASRGAGGRGPA